MNVSATARSSAWLLEWSVGSADSKLVLSYAVSAFEELYVSDRIWDRDPQYKRIPDPYGVYRFVHGQTLRLLFDQAPKLPGTKWPRHIYTPLFSRVRAGETHRGEVTIALPVVEYSSLQRDVDRPATLENVSLVQLILAYRLRSTLAEDPKPPLLESEAVGYQVMDPELMISTADVGALPVLRSNERIARPILPGDEGWQPKPPPPPAPPQRRA